MMNELTNRYLKNKTSSLEDIITFLHDDETKRIHFETTHSNALKPPKTGYYGSIQVPFIQTIGPILAHRFNTSNGQYLFRSKTSGFWRGFNSDVEYENFKLFIDEYKHIVFLRDTLDLSLALSMNMIDEVNRTEIGELEFQAKYKENKVMEVELCNLVKDWLAKLPFYNEANTICAMPCSDPAKPSLPRRLVDGVDKYENISDLAVWKKKNQSLKELGTVEDKLTALHEFELTINSDLRRKIVILLDDLYMSGVSMQYVALKLKEAGASKVYGLSIVKSRSNTGL